MGVLGGLYVNNWVATNQSSIASRRLRIYNVESHDLALLKSDYAKGKNLIMDEIYAWTGDQSYATTWTTWDDTMWLKIDDFSEVSVGKVTEIRSRVFKECKEKLVHAENAKIIQNGAFRKNKQLKTAIIGTETKTRKIHEKAFYDCKKLTKLKLSGKNLKQVGKNALGGDTDKKSLRIKIKGNKTQYNKAVKLFKKSGVKKAKFSKI